MVFLVPFDPQIPIFTFFSLLATNSYRIFTEDNNRLTEENNRLTEENRNRLTLQSDPLCGIPPTGGGCELDCDIAKNFPLVYSDPTCLSDCVVGEVEEEEEEEEIRNVHEDEEEECFRHLFKDFKDAGRIGMIFLVANSNSSN